jgi:hypothetical protein
MRILISHSVAAAVVSVGCLFAAPKVLAQQQVPAAPLATAASPLGLANAAHAQTDTGAAPATAMTHMAIQESAERKAVEWMERVSDAEYGKTPR